MEVSDQFLQISNIRHEKPNCPADLDVGVPPETSSKACEAPPTVASESFLRSFAHGLLRRGEFGHQLSQQQPVAEAQGLEAIEQLQAAKGHDGEGHVQTA
eukprot:g21636.t1